MALQKDITVRRFGKDLSFAAAYLCLQNIAIQQQEVPREELLNPEEAGNPLAAKRTVKEILWVGTCEVHGYVSKEAKLAREEPFVRIPVSLILDSGATENIHTVLYATLKLDPQFIGATDV